TTLGFTAGCSLIARGLVSSNGSHRALEAARPSALSARYAAGAESMRHTVFYAARIRYALLIQNAYPAYIRWEQFLRNKKRLDDNRSVRDQERRGAIREGAALLQGLVVCGVCGRRMSVHYTVHTHLYRDYVCAGRHTAFAEKLCQRVPGRAVDEAV